MTTRTRILIARAAHLHAVLIKFGWTSVLYLLNFGLAKLSLLVGPFLLIWTLEFEVYGTVEFAWASALFTASAVSLGIPFAYPQLVLLRNPIQSVDVLIASVVLPGAALAIVATLLLFVYPSSLQYSLASSCTVLSLVQTGLSTYCRTHSFRNWAAWLDGFSTYAVVTISLCVVNFDGGSLTAIAVVTAVIGWLCVFLGAILSICKKGPSFKSRFKRAVRTGIPIATYSVSTIWIAVSGRLYFGLALGANLLAIYSTAMRVAAVIVVFHTALVTGVFPLLYTMKASRFDRTIALYLAVICGISISLNAFIHFSDWIPMLLKSDVEGFRSIFPVITLHTFALLCYAALEMKVARARRALRAVSWTLVLSLVTASVIFGALFFDTVSSINLVWIVALQTIAAVAIQFAVLWKRGMKLRRTLAAFVLSMVILLAYSEIV